MKIGGVHYRSIWRQQDGSGPQDGGLAICVIDQTRLPFAFEISTLRTMSDAAHAIRTMIVRGAPLIGATAAWGVALAMHQDTSDGSLETALRELADTRPTAINLKWALDRIAWRLRGLEAPVRAQVAILEAQNICDEDADMCQAIGVHGLPVISAAAQASGRQLNILTHCNAGWLATVDFGTALSPIYAAHDAGIDLHVWVDETRPRNQGASLTAFELGAHGVPHTIIADNAGGHLMQHGKVDLCIVGTDRVAANGDVANKIGTYLKALAAHDNDVPFYVALPSPTIDWSIENGLCDIPIEERAGDEVTHVTGMDETGALQRVRVAAPNSPAANPAFDVTPARLVSGFMTERGVTPATREGLLALFGDTAAKASAKERA